METLAIRQGVDPCNGISSRPSTTSTGAVTDTDTQDLFSQKLYYDNPLSGLQQRNGNIASQAWYHRNSGQNNQTYSYQYDYLNRLTTATHGEIEVGNYSTKNKYNEAFSYDARGNIQTLRRLGMVNQPNLAANCYQPATIDSLIYVYETNSNKLSTVTDNAPCPDILTLPDTIDRDMIFAAGQQILVNESYIKPNVSLQLYAGDQVIVRQKLEIPKINNVLALVNVYKQPCPSTKYTEGFNQQSTAVYQYDGSGNLTYDPHKKLTFQYNYLNLPYQIIGAENDTLYMLYDAEGGLLQRKYSKAGQLVSKIDYLDGVEVVNNVMESVYHKDGRVVFENGTLKYEYYLLDHLANIRTVFVDDNADGVISGNEVRQRNDYYAFGLQMKGSTLGTQNILRDNKYQYNGKELIREMSLNLLDYGVRSLDPTLGRFLSIDILADEFPNLNPFHYVHNNPILLTDFSGMKADSAYTFDVDTKEFVNVGDTGGNEFDIITPVKTNSDGSKTVAGNSYIDNFIGVGDPQRGNPYRIASGQLSSLDGPNDPIFNILKLGSTNAVSSGSFSLNTLGIFKNKNTNEAIGDFVIYIFKKNNKVVKVGKADGGRITIITGLPTRVHQQLRKMGEGVSATVSRLGRVSTKAAKQIETSVLKKIYNKTGEVPKENQKSFKPKH